jgi:hypothetical protein
MATATHSEREHNELGGSSAERNYYCRGNIAFKAHHGLDREWGSKAAEEGTEFHELIDTVGQVLAAYYNKKKKLPAIEKLLDFPTKDNWSNEMQTHAKQWFENLYAKIEELKPNNIFPELVVEYPKPIVAHDREWKMGGPADFIFGYEKDGEYHLFLADAKYGFYLVNAESTQLLFYLCCTAMQFTKRKYSSGTVAIFQPREEDEDGDTWKEATYDGDVIYSWAKKFRKAGEESIGLIGQPISKIEKHLKAGGYCGFCKAKHRCPQWNALANENAVIDFQDVEDVVVKHGIIEEDRAARALIPLLDSPEKISKFLHFIPYLKKLIGHVQDYAIVSLLEDPDSVPGWKVIMGNGKRRFKKEEGDVARKLKEIGISNPYQQSLRGIGSIEDELKDLGVKPKDRKSLLEPLVERTQPGKNLVPIEDIRTAMQLGDNALDDFKDIELD